MLIMRFLITMKAPANYFSACATPCADHPVTGSETLFIMLHRHALQIQIVETDHLWKTSDVTLAFEQVKQSAVGRGTTDLFCFPAPNAAHVA